MTVNVTLQDIIRQVFAEIGESLNPAETIGIIERYSLLVDKQQRVLGQRYDWPQLRVREVFTVPAGKRYIQLPGELINQRIRRIEVFWSGRWQTTPLNFGISSAEYEEQDSEFGERRDPIEKYDWHKTREIELWPLPQTDQILRVTGARDPEPLRNQNDRAELDDVAIVLMTAADLLEPLDPGRASITRDRAERHIRQILGSVTPRKRINLAPGDRQPSVRYILRAPRNNA
ncbi:MAG: hypothetical protein MJH10_09360 [Epibacterium sp.]|nr:hypothetical protein [Epibacterium sp.]NQX73743.1 hypothetical protein [Epibacterium sp.]